MSNVALRVEGLGKRFRIKAGQKASYRTLRDAVTDVITAPFRRASSEDGAKDYWALKDVSFEVKTGQVVGLIGRNGAGKSTLLKVLSRITDPTEGYADIRGRVGSLLEVGTGFHPELSGRENVFLNGAILGMTQAEITAKFDEIVAFAEIEKFIDTPVKFYSSGMFVRLAFAVAAHLEPEILFVDEVLAVGDAAFQKKCLGKMQDVAQSGRTVVLVSHSMGAIAELCTHGVLLDAGGVVYTGPVGPAIEGYGRLIQKSQSAFSFDNQAWRPVNIVAARAMKADGERATLFDLSEDIRLEFEYRVHEPQFGLQLSFSISRNFIEVVRTFDTDGLESPLYANEPGLYRCSATIPGRFLKAGHYTITANAGTPQAVLQEIDSVLSFDIEELYENSTNRGYRRERPGFVLFPSSWKTEKVDSFPSGMP